MTRSGRAWVDISVLRDVEDEAQRWLPVETGGILMGYEAADEPDDVVVTAVIGAGPNAIRSERRFESDGPWQRDRVAEVFLESGRTVTYLGDWHSHARGRPTHSRTDRATSRRIARHPPARVPRPIMLITACMPDRRWVTSVYRYLGRRLVPMEIVVFDGGDDETPEDASGKHSRGLRRRS